MGWFELEQDFVVFTKFRLVFTNFLVLPSGRYVNATWNAANAIEIPQISLELKMISCSILISTSMQFLGVNLSK